MYTGLQADVAKVARAALATLRENGARTVEVSVPSLPYAAAVSFAIQLTEALSYHSESLRTRLSDYGPDVRRGLAMGQFVLGVQYVQAHRAAQILRREIDEALGRVDVLVSPTLAIDAPHLGETQVLLDGSVRDVNSVIGERTRLFNITGHPAITLPCGLSNRGLPVGLQIAGRHRDETQLLAIAGAYERYSSSTLPDPLV
jgi:aspartyl-tRNA(Asn)/glutamyl-tRNA(Gln) amidotransferase subunit A